MLRYWAITKTSLSLFLILSTLTPLFAAGRKTILEARGTQGSNGVRNPINESDVTVSGVATASDGIFLVHTKYDYTSFYIQDPTGGLNVYGDRGYGIAGIFEKDGSSRYVQEGDSITVTGKIMQYGGNMEIADPPLTIVIHSTGITSSSPGYSYLSPIDVTCAQASAKSTAQDNNQLTGGEIYEGKLIRIKNAKIKSTFVTKGGPSIVVNDGTGDLTMFIYNMTDIVRDNITLPSGNTALTITGVAGQYGKGGPTPSSTSSWLWSYQILARRNDDIVPQPSKTGSIESPDRIFRSESDDATVYVYDANVPGDTAVVISTVMVTVKSGTDPIGFTVVVNETKNESPGIYSFKLGISKTATNAAANPPVIKVVDDEIITLSYDDSANESGAANIATYNCYYKPQVSSTLLLIPKRVFSADKGERCEIRFNTAFNAEQNAKSNYRVTIRIFDILGREVKRLVDNAYLDSNSPGTVYWDGADDNGTPVPIGTYIVHIMTRDLFGVKMDEKMKTVAVGTKLN